MTKQVQKSKKEADQRRKLGQMVKNLALMIDDTTKKWYESKTFWVGAVVLVASVALVATEGAQDGTVLAAVSAVAMVVLRMVTNKGIR